MTVVTTQPAQFATQTPLSFRKNVAVWRADQLAAFRRAVTASMAVSDDRGWLHWAGLHGLPLPMYCQHHTPLFLPWHRAYLYYLELTLKEHEITATLPWFTVTVVPVVRDSPLATAAQAEDVLQIDQVSLHTYK